MSIRQSLGQKIVLQMALLLVVSAVALPICIFGVEHPAPDHLEHGVGLAGQAFLLASQNPHEKGSLDEAHEKIEQGAGSHVGI